MMLSQLRLSLGLETMGLGLGLEALSLESKSASYWNFFIKLYLDIPSGIEIFR